MKSKKKIAALVALPFLLYGVLYYALWGLTLSAETVFFQQEIAGVTAVRAIEISGSKQRIFTLSGSEAQDFSKMILFEAGPPRQGSAMDKLYFYKDNQLLATIWRCRDGTVLFDRCGPDNTRPTHNYVVEQMGATPMRMKLETATYLNRMFTDYKSQQVP